MKPIIFLFAAITLLSTSCTHKPDLMIDSMVISPDWAAGTHTADVTIKNVGNADAGSFYLYVEGHNSSTTYGQIVCQSTHNYPALAAGASEVFHADFDATGTTGGAAFAGIITVTAIADAKVMVAEKNEDNNTMEAPVL